MHPNIGIREKLGYPGVLSKTFGTNVFFDDVEKVANIVFRNSPLPVKKTGNYYLRRGGSGTMIVRVYENEAYEGTESVEFDDAVEIGEYTVDVPDNAKDGDDVKNTIEIQKDGRLTVITEMYSVETRHVIQLKGIHMDEDDIIDERKNMCNLVLD